MKDKLSLKVVKGIKINLFLKAISIILGFIMVRITYNYVNNADEYGLWLTILSILNWLNILDIGIGNGLRNSLTEALSSGKLNKARELVSTAYFFMSIIVVSFSVIFLIINIYIDWYKIFNLNRSSLDDLNNIMGILISTFIIKLVFQLINQVAYARHKSEVPALVNTISNLCIVINLYLFMDIQIRGLKSLAIIYSVWFLGISIVANIYLFKKRFRDIVPSLKFINIKYKKMLFNIGIKFFLIQIFNIIIFTTDSMIITHYLGPKDVIGYQLTYKIFSLYTMIFGIILIPIWSAITEAYTKNNIIWIKNKLNKLIRVFIVSVILIIMTMLVCNKIINIWMGEIIEIPSSLILLMGISTIITEWFSIFSYISNGMNRLNVQLMTYIIGGSLNIPLSIYFSVNLGLGVNGVMLATIMCISIFAILGPIDILNHLKKKESENI